MSISEYFIPFTRIGINLLEERLLIRMQGPQRGLTAWGREKKGGGEEVREPRGRLHMLILVMLHPLISLSGYDLSQVSATVTGSELTLLLAPQEGSGPRPLATQ